MNRSFFFEAEQAAGAVFGDWFGVEAPSHFGNDADELKSARYGCAMVNLAGWTLLNISGKDARDYLHRRLSNHIKKLQPGDSTYATLMGGDGRLIADLTVADAGGDSFNILAPPATCETLAANLEKYVIVEDVTVRDDSAALAALCLTGKVTSLESSAAQTVPLHWPNRAKVLFVPAADAAATWEKLRAAGCKPCGYIAWNTLRIEDGVPLFGADMTTSTIPLEANLDHAIDFNKGCFPGQEIVAKISNLGHPANKLVGLKLAPEDLPAAGCEILWGGKSVGRITSAVLSPTFNQTLALGYVKWDVREPGTTVEVQTATGAAPAVVCKLPFVT